MTTGTPTRGAVGVRRKWLEGFCIDRLPSTGFYCNFNTYCFIGVTLFACGVCIHFPSVGVGYCHDANCVCVCVYVKLRRQKTIL